MQNFIVACLLSVKKAHKSTMRSHFLKAQSLSTAPIKYRTIGIPTTRRRFTRHKQIKKEKKLVVRYGEIEKAAAVAEFTDNLRIDEGQMVNECNRTLIPYQDHQLGHFSSSTWTVSSPMRPACEPMKENTG